MERGRFQPRHQVAEGIADQGAEKRGQRRQPQTVHQHLKILRFPQAGVVVQRPLAGHADQLSPALQAQADHVAQRRQHEQHRPQVQRQLQQQGEAFVLTVHPFPPSAASRFSGSSGTTGAWVWFQPTYTRSPIWNWSISEACVTALTVSRSLRAISVCCIPPE